MTDSSPGFRCVCQQPSNKKMKVRALDCAENVAFMKFATQSTTHKEYIASNAVDGNGTSSAITKEGGTSLTHWWIVDFGGLKVIDTIEFRFKMRPTKDGYNVLFSNASNFRAFIHCYIIPQDEEEFNKYIDVSFSCSSDKVVSQFMKIELKSKKSLWVKNVNVMGWDP